MIHRPDFLWGIVTLSVVPGPAPRGRCLLFGLETSRCLDSLRVRHPGEAHAARTDVRRSENVRFSLV